MGRRLSETRRQLQEQMSKHEMDHLFNEVENFLFPIWSSASYRKDIRWNADSELLDRFYQFHERMSADDIAQVPAALERVRAETEGRLRVERERVLDKLRRAGASHQERVRLDDMLLGADFRITSPAFLSLVEDGDIEFDPYAETVRLA